MQKSMDNESRIKAWAGLYKNAIALSESKSKEIGRLQFKIQELQKDKQKMGHELSMLKQLQGKADKFDAIQKLLK